MSENEERGQPIMARIEVLEALSTFGPMGSALHNLAARMIEHKGWPHDRLKRVKQRVSTHLATLARERLVYRVCAGGWGVTQEGRKAIAAHLSGQEPLPELPLSQGEQDSPANEDLEPAIREILEGLGYVNQNMLEIGRRVHASIEELRSAQLESRQITETVSAAVRLGGVPVDVHMALIERVVQAEKHRAEVFLTDARSDERQEA